MINITNGHIHIFVSECAPPNFLRVNDLNFLKFIAKPLKWVLERRSVRRTIWKLNSRLKFLSLYRKNKLDRILSFLNIGAQLRQKDVFELAYNVVKNYDSNPRLITHTLDMDYMDNQSKPIINFATQLYEAMEIKKIYPDNILIFIGVDPRTRSGKHVVDWIQPYFNKGVKSKIDQRVVPFGDGIKLYPAHGFFPFDPKLDELYSFAQEKNIPLMFHCTRYGSQYIGSEIEELIPYDPDMILPENPGNGDEVQAIRYQEAIKAQSDIYKRIKRYKDELKWIKNSKIGKNEFACDLFSHPQNYIPIMCKYPDLKICLAHMGGAEEVKYMNGKKAPNSKEYKNIRKVWDVDRNWADLIKKIMHDHLNFYTDVSSVIAHFDDQDIVNNITKWLEEKDAKGEKYLKRVLFGTDFFMTERSKSEAELFSLMRKNFSKYFDEMTDQNYRQYLMQ